MKFLVTGGCGFIGSAVIRRLIGQTDHEVVNVDKLTYAGDPRTVAGVSADRRYTFEKVDITDGEAIGRVFQAHQPDVVLHLAAESHVDRSIDGPGEFVQTNVIGTFNLLQESLRLYQSKGDQSYFRFVHVSTDEVFGSLGENDPPFDASTPYAPRSPYSASKAASDHLVRAWGETYGLPTSVTNCSNNYGPFHFPEKLIPLMIIKSLAGEQLPVYGAGQNIRDWLFVEDHARALIAVGERGRFGATYTLGGNAERTNLAVVQQICDLVDELASPLPDGPRRQLIEFVTDRPGHDHRYAVNSDVAHSELGWAPSQTFEQGLRTTIGWYLENQHWWQPILDTKYAGHRLGAM